MMINLQREAHAQRLERWLGAEHVEQLGTSMRAWYGPPIAVQGVPGAVFATRGGFIGHVDAGHFGSAYDRLEDALRRELRRVSPRLSRWARRQLVTLPAGFASLSDLIAEATAGKRQDLAFTKVSLTSTASATHSLFFASGHPAAGSAPAAAPGGTVTDVSTTGALPFNAPTGGDTTHFVGAYAVPTVTGNQLLLYDRLFGVDKTMNSTATEAVTGVPTRYTSITAGAADSAEGNFLMVEGRTALPATIHNWTVCTYTDQSGNTGATLPSVAGNASNHAGRLDMPLGHWFAPLAAGDTGIKALTQMQCSALVASGTVGFAIGHPLAWMPCPVANLLVPVDGINTAFNLVRIFDSACLAFLEVAKGASTATTYAGSITLVAG
jgi:hypothetical protein